MEDNKDFENGQFEEQGTQQMPDVPDGNDGNGGSGGKKATVKLFGHEFDRKKVVMAGLGGLLALALVGGGIAYAASQQTKGGGEPQPVVQAEKKDETEREWVVQLGAKADGWKQGESSPVIAHIVSKDEGIDYYHAYDANANEALPVPAEGGYEVSLIAPVNADGSTYKAPEKGKAQAEADNHNKMLSLPYTFEKVKAEDMKAEDIAGILSAVSEAVKKGDETLTGENGVKAVELVEKNLKANPNADKEKVEAEADKAAEDAKATPPAGKGDSGKKQDSGNAGGSSSSSGNGNSGNSNASSSNGNKPQAHAHNWVAQTTTVHHDAQYQTVHHDAEYKTVHHDAVTEEHYICNGCGADITGDPWGHIENSMMGGGSCGGYHSAWVTVKAAWDEQVLVKAAWDEQIEVSPAWDETITTGYKCSCGATK